jgi:hypothetical protein
MRSTKSALEALEKDGDIEIDAPVSTAHVYT